MICRLGALIGIGLLVAVGGPAQAQEETLDIVTTTGMIADIATAVGGDRVTVTSICGEGVDPHLYQPRASDIRRIMAADMVLYNGLYLEGKVDETFERAKARGKVVEPVAAAVGEAFLLMPEGQEGHPDPHVWMDIEGWKAASQAVTEMFCAKDPEGCDTYRANAAKWTKAMDEMNTYVKTSLATVPKGRRVLVTAHDAFGYFGRAYDIEVMGIQGVSTESEAGLGDVNALVRVLVERKIPAVFVESSVPDKYVRAIIEGAASHGHEVVIGGELYSDAMGAPGTYTGTYLGMMDHNATTITRALGGSAPVAGHTGRLMDEHATAEASNED